MNSKERDDYYGVQPKNRELTREDLPTSPARKPSSYCKKLKGEHIFTLFDVTIYPHHRWISGEFLVTGLSRWKEYRCTGCSKKKGVWEEATFDTPVKELARI